MRTLPNFYTGELPSGSDDWVEYIENLAGLEMARQVYEYLFQPIFLESMRKTIRHACYIGDRQGRPVPTIEEEMNSPEDIIWDYVNITFDYNVALGDEPNAVQLTVGEDLKVIGHPHRLDKERKWINGTVKTVPGMPEE
jgi:hypothetical protein